jgi:hypothetical protein
VLIQSRKLSVHMKLCLHNQIRGIQAFMGNASRGYNNLKAIVEGQVHLEPIQFTVSYICEHSPFTHHMPLLFSPSFIFPLPPLHPLLVLPPLNSSEP